jgi:predicted 3-demethylubiquinone-9 3-methyltransferase (glyoxalase superfamily)
MPGDVTPFLMFEGRAEEALRYYEETFPAAEVVALERWSAGEQGPEGSFKKGTIRIAGEAIHLFDSPVEHAFGFTPAVSLFVECADLAEFESLYARLAEDGKVLMEAADYGFSERFAWVDDRFGVSWQLNVG